MPILTLGVGDIFVCHDILVTQDTNSSTGYVRRCDVLPVASVVKTVLMSFFLSLTPFSAMSIWSPKSFVVGRLFLYWPVSRFARKSKAKSKSKSRGETGDVWRGSVQVQKIAQEGDSPYPAV